MGSGWYKLDENRNPVPRPEGEDHEHVQVAYDEIGGETGRVRVSTVFLGLDFSHGDEPPVLFETMIIGGPLGQEQERYCTWAEAEAGHARWAARVRRLAEPAAVDISREVRNIVGSRVFVWCDDLRGALSGAADPLDPIAEATIVAQLATRLAFWTPSIPAHQVYDDCVRALIHAVLREYDAARPLDPSGGT